MDLWRDACVRDPERVWEDLRELGYNDYLVKRKEHKTRSERRIPDDDEEVNLTFIKSSREALVSMGVLGATGSLSPENK